MRFQGALARILVALLLFAVVCAPLLASEQGQKEPEKKFVGSKNSNKYHNLSCTWARRIRPENRVHFASAVEAEKAGYVACKVCKPK